MATKRSIGQNALYNSVGALFNQICLWLITVLVVHLSSLEDAGVLSLSMSLSNMFYSLAACGMRDYQVSDYANRHSTTTYVTTRIFTCFCSAIICSVVLFFGAYNTYQVSCILLYLLFRLSEAFIDVLAGIQQRAERMDYTGASFVIRGVGTLGGFCLALWLTKDLRITLAVIALFSLAIAVFFDLPVAKKLDSFSLHFRFADTRALLWRCAPLICNSFLTASIVSIPRSTLEALCGSHIMGIYGSVATPAVIVQAAAMWLYSPTLTTFTRCYAQKDKKSFYALYRKIWFIIACAVLVVLAGAKLLGRWGLQLLFTEEVADHAYLLIPVLGTTFLIAASYFLGAMITITRHLKVIVLSNAVAMGLVLLLSTPLIRSFGMDGVNYVILIAMGVNVILLFATLSILLRKHFNSAEQPANGNESNN